MIVQSPALTRLLLEHGRVDLLEQLHRRGSIDMAPLVMSLAREGRFKEAVALA